MRFLESAAAVPHEPKGRGVTRSWVFATDALTAKLTTLGATCRQPDSFLDRVSSLAVLSRSSAYCLWRKSLVTGVPITTADGRPVLRNADRLAVSMLRPSPHPPRQHVASLYFRGRTEPTVNHSAARLTVPLSYAGPKGGFGVSSSTGLHRTHTLVCLAKLGSAAFNFHPFAAPSPLRRAVARDSESDSDIDSDSVPGASSSSTDRSSRTDSTPSCIFTDRYSDSDSESDSTDSSSWPAFSSGARDSPSRGSGCSRDPAPDIRAPLVEPSSPMASTVSSAMPAELEDLEYLEAQEGSHPMAPVMCKFCRASLADVRHLFCECKAPWSTDLRSLQRNTQAAAERMLHTIADELYNIADHIQPQQDSVADSIRDHVDEFIELLPGMEWRTRDARFLLHRLLLVLPFPPSEIDEHDMPVSHRFAAMLQATTVLRYRARRLFTKWTQWASRTLHQLASLWRSAP